MLSRLTSTSALSIHVPPTIFPAGSSIEGEVSIDFRQLHEENIEQVQVQLHGAAKSWIHRDKSSSYETILLVRDAADLWSRSNPIYPSPGSDVLCVPFAFKLPEQLPPSFHYKGLEKSGAIRYSLTAVGVRKGILNFNKRHCLPLTIVPKDEYGAQIRKASDARGWKPYSKEEKIRKGLWGEYSKVTVEFKLPDIPVLPLLTDIPYSISITTVSAPMTQAKSPPPDKPLFPAVPMGPDGVEFKLHRRLRIRTKVFSTRAGNDISCFLGKGAAEERNKTPGKPRPPVDVEIPPREWIPEGAAAPLGEKDGKRVSSSGSGDPDGKGIWVQRATFGSTFRLDVPPSFALHNIECAYDLIVKVPFSGIGNDVKLEIPVNVTSGIDKPMPVVHREDLSPLPTLDLPPAYWDADDKEWSNDEKN